MLIKEEVLFNKEECESIISYNNTHIKNWIMSDRKYNSKPIDYNEGTKWLFEKLKDFFEVETGLEIIKFT